MVISLGSFVSSSNPSLCPLLQDCQVEKLNSLFHNWPPEERTGPGGSGWGRGTPSTKTNRVAVHVMGSLAVKAFPSFLGWAMLFFYYCLPQIMQSWGRFAPLFSICCAKGLPCLG